MRSNRVNYVLVGLFVLAMLVGLVIALALLTGRTGATDSYFVVYRNVQGLSFGSQVVYEGYPIGQVEDITPMNEGAGMQFRVDLSVQEGWQIPSDSIAAIAAPGLLAAVTISISAGESTIPLKPGDEIQGREAVNVFSVFGSVAARFEEIAEQDVRPLLASLDTAVSTFSEIMADEGRLLVQELDVLAKELATRIPVLVDDVEALVQELRIAGREVNEVFSPENRERVEALLVKADRAAGNFGALSQELRQTRARVDGVLESLDTIILDNRLDVERVLIDLRHIVDSLAHHVDSVSQNLDGAARNLNEFSRQIRRNPGLLLGGSPPQDEAASGR